MRFFDAERRQCGKHMAERSSEKDRENSQEMQRPNLKTSPSDFGKKILKGRDE